MNHREQKRQKQRVQSDREELAERMTRLLPANGSIDPLPGVRLSRSSELTDPASSLYQPSFCFVVQGVKRALLGGEVFRYDSGHYLVFTVDLPLVFQVEEASPEQPYLGLRVHLDPSLVASVMMEVGAEIRKGGASVKAITVSATDADLTDTVVRLVRSLETPGGRRVLAPLVKRELVYRLLTGGQGARLSHLLTAGRDTGRISRAIVHLREHYDEPLRMENVARDVGMSVSGFHHRFRSVTAMSPLQFQKQIRLQEARRLMLGGDLDAASVGMRVGYEDPAYFSRDYKKLFGAPPQRDAARLRGQLEANYA